MSEKNNFNNLTYFFTNPNLAPIIFIGFRGPLNIYNEIGNGNISIKKAEEDQNKFKSSLSEITARNPKYKKQYQVDAIEKIKNLSNSRQNTINLFNDYAKIKSEAMFKTKHETGLEILTPKPFKD